MVSLCKNRRRRNKMKEQIEGRLENWYRFNGQVCGNIFNDKKLRWPDGYPICTSTVTSKDLKEGDLIKTKNSIYLLGKKHND